jgi:hypothetical protein
MEFWLLQAAAEAAEELPRDGLEILGLLEIIIPQGNLPMPVMQLVSAAVALRGAREVAEELILEELAAAVQMPQELQLAVEVGLLLEVVRVVEEDLYQHQM